jgi:hypothetical protein
MCEALDMQVFLHGQCMCKTVILHYEAYLRASLQYSKWPSFASLHASDMPTTQIHRDAHNIIYHQSCCKINVLFILAEAQSNFCSTSLT